MIPSDNLAKYQTQKRVDENRLPRIAATLLQFSPPITRRSNYLHQPNLTKSHLEILSKIYSLIHSDERKTNWDGIYLLLQWNNMVNNRHGMDEPFSISFNHVEAHRRILNIEKACSEMIQYMVDCIAGTHKHLRLVAVNSLVDAHAVLVSENLMEVAAHISKVIPAPSQSHLTERLDWLKGNRSAALTRHSFLTELDWGMGLIGLFHNIAPSMGKLDDELEAATVLTTIMAFLDKRASIYAKDMEPLLYYGSNLTMYTVFLHDICQNFSALGTKSNVTFMQIGRFHELDIDGRILGSDGRVVVGEVPGRKQWLIPFPLESPKSDDMVGLEELCAAHAKEEMDLVLSMLAELGVASPILDHMKVGHDRIKKLLSEDSFLTNLTSILPPSASMPDAWYDPDAIFAL